MLESGRTVVSKIPSLSPSLKIDVLIKDACKLVLFYEGSVSSHQPALILSMQHSLKVIRRVHARRETPLPVRGWRYTVSIKVQNHGSRRDSPMPRR